jgi:hypothetical protein
MRRDCRFVRRAAVECLRDLMIVNATRSWRLYRRPRFKVTPGWFVEAGRAQLSVRVLNFTCRFGGFAAGPRPELLLAICLSAVVNVVVAFAEHIYASVALRESTHREENRRAVPEALRRVK